MQSRFKESYTLWGTKKLSHSHRNYAITVIEIKYWQTLVTVKHSFKEAKMVANDDCSI